MAAVSSVVPELLLDADDTPFRMFGDRRRENRNAQPRIILVSPIVDSENVIVGAQFVETWVWVRGQKIHYTFKR